ncbi:general substrate transporter [Pseudovirgaria hyperparasitica]|uniref:General substrate transporter n=1 Tax=Pseudovirgaria hyperparasitica TaxID=470096 RepID=A0A6A6W159_9PEZI|nr:general substrate transporter [Pseudovirgaria hyperparasitica]KAF2756265.1 general substrate transporter [Pseudovirgaria hyperparasitica]
MFHHKKNMGDTPKEVLNWRMWYGVFVFGMMGAARGLDEGLIGTTATLPSFSNQFRLKDPALSEAEQDNRLSNITSMVQLGSILGALIGFYITDKIGRLWATRELCVVWVSGIAIYLGAAAHGSLGMIYAGRFIAGIGIGQTTVVAPTYLAETAPRAIRGLCVCIFSGNVYLGIMLGYFAAYGSSLHIAKTSSFQWVNCNLLHIYFAFIIFTASWFAKESPRWLIKVGRHEEAAKEMSTLRNLPIEHPYVQTEIIDINDQLNREREATLGLGWMGYVKELFLIPANRYRVMLSVMSQLLGQWSGANSITIYAPEYFEMVGQTGTEEKLFATAIFGVVKFVSAMLCAFFLIDWIGRKRALYTGISLQAFAMLYMALFLVIDTTVDDESIPQSPSQKRAAIGAIVMIYLSGFGWAMGWNSIQYLINSEIYPLRLRAIGGSLAMTVHFANQYGNSKAVPSMFTGLTTGGTMFFFAAITCIGLIWVYFFLPETQGKSLEAMDAMFSLPWYLIGRKGAQMTQGIGSTAEVYGMDEKVPEIETLERIPSESREKRADA